MLVGSCDCVCVYAGCFQASLWMMALILKGVVRSHKTWELFHALYISWQTAQVRHEKMSKRLLTFGASYKYRQDWGKKKPCQSHVIKKQVSAAVTSATEGTAHLRNNLQSYCASSPTEHSSLKVLLSCMFVMQMLASEWEIPELCKEILHSPSDMAIWRYEMSTQ